MGKIILEEQAAADTPAANKVVIYPKAGGGLYKKDDAGDEVALDQTVGIADDNLLEVDDADAADNDYAKFTASGLEGRSYPEVLADLSGQATAEFLFNTQKLGGVVDPTTDQQVATKKYVDDNAGGGLVEQSVNDESEITLDTGKTGWGQAMAGDNEEYIEFRFTAAGAVTVIANSANAVNTDTDGNLCVYDAGTGIAIKNRLGATKTIRYVVNYSA